MRTALLLHLALLAASPVIAQAPLRLIRTVEHENLFRVRAAAVAGERIVVLTAVAPYVHVWEGSRYRSWGSQGRGPAELTEPAGLLLTSSQVLVRDSELRKLAIYNLEGALASSRPLTFGMVVRVELTGADTLAEVFSPAGRVVARMRGTRADTLLRYSTYGPTVRLSAPGSASLTIPAPFSPLPVWAPLPHGRLVYWDGRQAAVQVLDRSGRAVFSMPLPAGRYPVTPADREAWFSNAIPGEIRGQSPFRGLQDVARREVRFPSQLPPVLSLRADLRGGVWVQQTLAATGQRWLYLAPRQPQTWFRLRPGESLLAVGAREVLVLAKDADDVEVIRVYAHPFVS